MDLSMRIVWVRRSEGSAPAVKELGGVRGHRAEDLAFEGSALEEAEHVHAEFFQVLREDELPRWV